MTIVWQSCNLTSVIWQPCRVIWHPRILKEKPHPVWQTEKRSCSRARVSKNVWRRSSARKKSFFSSFSILAGKNIRKERSFLVTTIENLRRKRSPSFTRALRSKSVCVCLCVRECVCVCTHKPSGGCAFSILSCCQCWLREAALNSHTCPRCILITRSAGSTAKAVSPTSPRQSSRVDQFVGLVVKVLRKRESAFSHQMHRSLCLFFE